MTDDDAHNDAATQMTVDDKDNNALPQCRQQNDTTTQCDVADGQQHRPQTTMQTGMPSSAILLNDACRKERK
jgi:hypothetical protein